MAGGGATLRGSTRLGAVAVGLACAAALLAYYLIGYLMVRPPAVSASSGPPRARLTLQTVASLGIGPHPDWVSYLVKDPQGHWRHSTVLNVPANSPVRITCCNTTRRRVCAIPTGAARAGSSAR